ncbi:MAG: DUF2889 domain-containing protein [Rhodospirillales bacterium]
MHTRTIVCQGFRREDGLWDIEGRITDTKSYSFANHDRGGIAAGEPLHDMIVRLTIDSDRKVIHAEAATENAPFSICPSAAGAVGRLEGLRIAPGWRRGVIAAMGGVKGCTHITDLVVGPMATTAFQTVIPDGTAEGKVRDRRPAEQLVNSCHAFASDGPVVKREFPAHYTGDGERSEQ